MFTDPELELALASIVHGDQRFDYRDPLRAGGRRLGHAHHRQGPSPGGFEIISSVVISGADGVERVTASATFVHSRRRHDHGDRDRARSGDRGRLAHRAADPGAAGPLRRRVGCDFNPIHYSDHFATALGLPGVIAHGMLTMGTAPGW